MRTLAIIVIISTAFIGMKCTNLKGSENVTEVQNLTEPGTVELERQLKDKETTYGDLFAIIRSMNSELNKTKTIDDFVFDASYQPHLLLALMNSDSVDTEKKINQALLKKTDEYNKLHYIKFSVENKNFKSELLRYQAGTAEEYSERVSYYSFHIKKDVYLIENTADTIKGAFVNFERTFDMSPRLNITFVFERKKTTPLNKLTFVFEDVVFNNGKLNFEFDYKKIAPLNSPDIKKIIL